MDIYFCDICNESVPQSDLDRGMAFRRGERVVCFACDSSMSQAEGGAATPDKPLGDADEGEGPSAAAGVAPAEAKASGSSAEVEVSASSGGGNLSGCFACCLGIAIVIFGYSWGKEALEKQAELTRAVEDLRSADEATGERFSDMQISLSRSGQQEAEATSAAIAKVQADSDEKVANLRVRLGRLENSLEALRQATTEDRRLQAAELKEVQKVAESAAESADQLVEGTQPLLERVAALEEVLSGGLAGAGSPDSGGRAPSWAVNLADLRDASAGNRWTAVTVLGDTGDERVVPHLLPMLADEDVFVRMATARVLGELGSEEAIPALIETLSDGQAAVREATVVALRVLSGKDFRFDPLGKDADRRKAQDAWRKWHKEQ